MISYKYQGNGAGLIRSGKTNWTSGRTATPILCVHGGPMLPSIVRTFGITPEKASEFLVTPLGAPISGGKMVFAFMVCTGATPPDRPEKPPGVKTLWGYKGHMYLFSVPVGTTYWSMNAILRPGCEVAFEYVVESSDIVQYWPPSQLPDERKNFTPVGWQQYLLSALHHDTHA